jgi:thiol-disulfide isomerase/thioredoxin
MDLEPSTPQENPQDEIPAAEKASAKRAVFAGILFVAVVGGLFLTFSPGTGSKTEPVAETYASARAQFNEYRGGRELPANGVIHFIPDGDRSYNKVETFLKDEKGRPMMIYLWASWCRPCQAEMIALDKLYDDFTAAGAFVVPVMTADRSGIGGARYFFKGADIVKLPYYLDHDREFLDALGMRSLPTLILVGPDGGVVAYSVGPKIESRYVQDILFAFARTGKLPD